MAIAMPDDLGGTLQKGLSEWWSEETEYVFQRIERWAAFARGYNRLRSQRLSRGRLTMHEEQEPRWRISSNKIVIDDTSWSPRFHTSKKSRRRSRGEEVKINCCGTLNYQSSSNLDSTCLETYRYDHSIYFKTIGDLKNSKKDLSAKEDEDRVSISSEEMVEWDVEAAAEFISNHFGIELPKTSISDSARSTSPSDTSWPVVDFSNLQIEPTEVFAEVVVGPEEIPRDESNREKCFEMMRQESEQESDQVNNNIEDATSGATLVLEETRLNNNVEVTNSMKDNSEDPMKRYRGRRSSRIIDNSSLIIDNDVGWSDILLNPTDNVDPPTYS